MSSILSHSERINNALDRFKHNCDRPFKASHIKIEHEESSFNPLRYTNRYGKLTMCPYSKVINKHCFATGKKEKIVVPCGRCYYCNHRRQNALIFRINNHMKYNKYAYFVTLTYNPQHYPVEPELCKSDAQKFYKRLRKKFDWKTFTYFHTCERGSRTGRLHHHFILFWNDDNITYKQVYEAIYLSWFDKARCFKCVSDVLYSIYADNCSSDLSISSPIGFIYCTPVEPGHITYVTKYINKNNRKACTVFQTWSKGLGADILSNPDFVDKARYLNLMTYQPNPVLDKRYYAIVPKYYKDKIFTQAERDKMFILYLSSEDYKSKLHAVKDPDFVLNQLDIFKGYRKQCDEVEHAHEIDRIKRFVDI